VRKGKKEKKGKERKTELVFWTQNDCDHCFQTWMSQRLMSWRVADVASQGLASWARISLGGGRRFTWKRFGATFDTIVGRLSSFVDETH